LDLKVDLKLDTIQESKFVDEFESIEVALINKTIVRTIKILLRTYASEPHQEG